MKNLETLGLILHDLSTRDICEELTDIRRDISAIEDYEKGLINYSEMREYTSFEPKDKPRLINAFKTLKEEKLKRNGMTIIYNTCTDLIIA